MRLSRPCTPTTKSSVSMLACGHAPAFLQRVGGVSIDCEEGAAVEHVTQACRKRLEEMTALLQAKGNSTGHSWSVLAHPSRSRHLL